MFKLKLAIASLAIMVATACSSTPSFDSELRSTAFNDISNGRIETCTVKEFKGDPWYAYICNDRGIDSYKVFISQDKDNKDSFVVFGMDNLKEKLTWKINESETARLRNRLSNE